MRSSREHGYGWGPIAVIVALLVALAVLQYRWIGEVSRLERLRLEDAVAEAMLDLADDVDLEVSRLASTFALPSLDELPEALARWRSSSEHPELLAEILVWWPSRDVLERWSPASDTLEPEVWPENLRSALPRMRTPRGSTPRAPAGGPLQGGPSLLLPRPPALVLPVFPGPVGDPRRRSLRARRSREPGARVVVRLDERVLREEILPLLIDRHFGGAAALPVEVTVLAPGLPGGGDPTGHEVAYSTLDRPRAEAGADSFVVPLLRVRFFPELRAERRMADRAAAVERGARRHPPIRSAGAPAEPAEWTLVVDAAAGSLDATVARLRWRNLAISAAILCVLGVSLALVLAAARRRQELAQRQLALVAGITHELHTPLAALQAAAQNLEDGVVRDPERIREYGGLVRREGGRLQKLVDQTLALAGMRAGDQALALRRVALQGAIDRALGEAAGATPEAEAEVAVDVPTHNDQEPISAWTDPDALHRILVNLLTNARKYGGGRIWIGARPSGARVAIHVVDDGPGIAPGERVSLFEPFHRGQRARERTAPGSGLGLYLSRSLAQAMGGELEAIDADSAGAPTAVRGAAFRLELPTGPEA